jgi:hypothetical protein
MTYHAEYRGHTKKSINFGNSQIIPKVEITSRVLPITVNEFSKGSFNLTWIYSENMTRFTLDTSFAEDNITSGEVWSAFVLNNEDLFVSLIFSSVIKYIFS